MCKLSLGNLFSDAYICMNTQISPGKHTAAEGKEIYRTRTNEWRVRGQRYFISCQVKLVFIQEEKSSYKFQKTQAISSLCIQVSIHNINKFSFFEQYRRLKLIEIIDVCRRKWLLQRFKRILIPKTVFLKKYLMTGLPMHIFYFIVD